MPQTPLQCTTEEEQYCATVGHTNTTKVDVLNYVNKEMKKICNGELNSINSF